MCLILLNQTTVLLSLGASAFQAMQYLPHQQPGYPVHSHFTSQPGSSLHLFAQLFKLILPSVGAHQWDLDSSSPGYIPGAGIPLQKQLEHANQQSGFTDAVRQRTCTAVQRAALFFTSLTVCWCSSPRPPGCVEADAPSHHASLCSRAAGHTSNGRPNSHCKGESFSCTAQTHFGFLWFHQWGAPAGPASPS